MIGKIKQLFKENHNCFGYRRIHALLKREGIIISEKVVRRLMAKAELLIPRSKTKKYNSYKGEISEQVDNVIQRNFNSDNPNEKLLTDITEFAIADGKVYLSALVDCFDGMVSQWSVGTALIQVLSIKCLMD